MHRPHRSGRRQRRVRRPRHHRTAPVVFYLPQACEHDYDDYEDDHGEHHYRYTEQHYLEDLDEGSGDNEGYGGYGDERQGFRRRQQEQYFDIQQFGGPNPRHDYDGYEGYCVEREDSRPRQQQPQHYGTHWTDSGGPNTGSANQHPYTRRNPPRSINPQPHCQASSRSDSYGKSMCM